MAGQSARAGNTDLPRIGLSASNMTIRLSRPSAINSLAPVPESTHLMRGHAIFSRPLSASTTSSAARGTQRIDGNQASRQKAPAAAGAFYLGKSSFRLAHHRKPAVDRNRGAGDEVRGA